MDITSTSEKNEPSKNKKVKFQVQLITMVLLNAFKKLHSWRLLAENEQTGELNNAVLEWTGGSLFLQAKHSETGQITFKDLLSSSSENDDFSIARYFLRYQQIKDKYQGVNVVVCTNAMIETDKENEKFINHQTACQDSVLHCNGHGGVYTFNKTIIPALKESVRNSNDKAVITDENIKDFLQHLQFSYGYPSEKDMDNVIEGLLYGKKLSNVFYEKSSGDILNEVTKWFENLKVDEYLTDSHASAIFCKIRSKKFCQILKGYGVSFKTNEFNFYKTKNVFHIVAKNSYLLQTIKIFRALQINNTNALYINPDDDVDMKSATIDAFELLDHPFLIINWPEIIEEDVLRNISAKLRGTLAKYKQKKIILIGETNNKLICEIKDNISDIITIERLVAFDDLTEDSREKIINKDCILFQGNYTSLKELLGVQTTEFYGRAVDSEILEKLVRGEKIKVGSVVRPLDKDIACYYIPRKFAREIEEEEETYSEENICEVSDKFVIIENRGGMGKSTVLTNLAAVIKHKHPHLWVIRIEFNKYKDVLKEFRKRSKDKISVTELLDFHDTTKLQTELEKLAFLLDNKVVLILDAVDEISDDVNPYLELILNLFKQCQDASNIAKVFIASREHAIQALIEKLDVTPFKLLPFDESDYIEFFVKFWTSKLSLPDHDKCQEYSSAVVSKMGRWIDPDFSPEEDLLDVAPLQLQMLAEIFQESNRFGASEDWDGCTEFLSANKSRPKLPKKIKNITDLFNKLIEKKRDGFFGERNSSECKDEHEMTLKKYNECLDYRKML